MEIFFSFDANCCVTWDVCIIPDKWELLLIIAFEWGWDNLVDDVFALPPAEWDCFLEDADAAAACIASNSLCKLTGLYAAEWVGLSLPMLTFVAPTNIEELFDFPYDVDEVVD